jgi:hypothetical protein
MGTREYFDPSDPTERETVYLCRVHLASPPETNPKGHTEGYGFRDGALVMIAFIILVYALAKRKRGLYTPRPPRRDVFR